MSRKLLAAAACAFVVLASRPAFADPSPADRALAHALFEEGRALGKAGKWGEACMKLEASQKLAAGIGTLFNLGDCYEHVGRTASAFTAFTETAEQARAANQPDREAIASSRAAALAPKLAKMRLDLKGSPAPSGFEVRIDGRLVPPSTVTSELPVDPGEHSLSFAARGKKSREQRIRIEVPGSVLLVEVPPLENEDLAASYGVPPPPPPAPVTEPPDTAHVEQRPWQLPLAITTGAVALAGIGVGTFFGLRANSQWSDAKGACPANDCDDKGYDGWKNARTSGTVSTIAFIAGGVLAATAIVLLVTAPSRRSAAALPRTFASGGAF